MSSYSRTTGEVEKSGADLLNRIVNNINDIIGVHGPDGCYRYVTPSVKAVLGYAPEEMLDISLYEQINPDDGVRMKHEAYTRALEGKTLETNIEYRFRKKDGSYVWLQTQITPIFGVDAAVTELLSVSRDISDRKQAEQALRESEESYQQLFLNDPVVRLLIDSATGNILDANQAAADFYGYTAAELRAMTIFAINTAAAADIRACMAKVSQGYRKAIPFWHKLKDGSIRDVEVYSGPVRVRGKTTLLSVVIDVTDRKKVEEELRVSRERLALVVEGAKAGIWDWDMRSDRVFRDKQWKAILGYEENGVSEELDQWTSRWHPEDAVRIKAAMEDYLQGKTQKYEIEYRIRRQDGTSRWVLTTGKLTRDQAGQPIRWTGLNIDITDRKRMEELYQESEKRLRDFAEALPGSSFIIDEDGQYLEVFGNAGMLSIPKDQFRGQTVYQVLQEDDADFVLNEVRQTITSGKQRIGFRVMKIGPEKRYISGCTVPLSYIVDGKRTAAAIATDITDQHRTETMLQVTYELRRRSDLINDLLNGKVFPDESLACGFREIGLEMRSPVFGCKLLSDKFDFGGRNQQAAGIDSIQKRKDGVLVALSEIPNCIAWDCREGIGVFCRATFKIDEWERSKEVAALIRAKLLEYDASLAVYVGVGEIHTGLEGLKKSCRQALSAALAARCRAAKGMEIVHYREAGIFQFIPEPLGEGAAQEYIEQHIGRLIAYDRGKRTNYLMTLEEILHGASVREIAERQFLHPKTVIFRQKRIAKILNVDLGDYQTRLALALALQLQKLNNA